MRGSSIPAFPSDTLPATNRLIPAPSPATPLGVGFTGPIGCSATPITLSILLATWRYVGRSALSLLLAYRYPLASWRHLTGHSVNSCLPSTLLRTSTMQCTMVVGRLLMLPAKQNSVPPGTTYPLGTVRTAPQTLGSSSVRTEF